MLFKARKVIAWVTAWVAAGGAVMPISGYPKGCTAGTQLTVGSMAGMVAATGLLCLYGIALYWREKRRIRRRWAREQRSGKADLIL